MVFDVEDCQIVLMSLFALEQPVVLRMSYGNVLRQPVCIKCYDQYCSVERLPILKSGLLNMSPPRSFFWLRKITKYFSTPTASMSYLLLPSIHWHHSRLCQFDRLNEPKCQLATSLMNKLKKLKCLSKNVLLEIILLEV